MRTDLISVDKRTAAEQAVGFCIFLSLCFGVEICNQWMRTGFSLPFLENSPWIVSAGTCKALWTLYAVFLASAMWSLWRTQPLRALKWETGLFCAALVFQIGWGLSFFLLQEMLLALTFLTLLWCNHLVAIFLFWKKDRLSGVLLFAPFLWILYVMGVNMMICTCNP